MIGVTRSPASSTQPIVEPKPLTTIASTGRILSSSLSAPTTKSTIRFGIDVAIGRTLAVNSFDPALLDGVEVGIKQDDLAVRRADVDDRNAARRGGSHGNPLA